MLTKGKNKYIALKFAMYFLIILLVLCALSGERAFISFPLVPKLRLGNGIAIKALL